MTRVGSATDVLLSGVSLLWVVAVLTYGVGDLLTTGAGLRTAGIAEAGPVVASLLNWAGIVPLIVLKLAVFGFGYGLWRLVPGPHDVGVPLGLASVGVVVTAWNLLVLSGNTGFVVAG